MVPRQLVWSQTTGSLALSSPAPTLQPQHRKSHLKASPGGSCGGVGGVLGHPLNCLSTGTSSFLPFPSSRRWHSGWLGSGVWALRTHLLLLLFCCNTQLLSICSLEPAGAKEVCPLVGSGSWGQNGPARALLGVGGDSGNRAGYLLTLLAYALPPRTGCSGL